MKSVEILVNVTVESVDEASEISNYIHDILNEQGITNSVEVTDKVSE